MSEHRETCEYCKSTFKNKTVLKTHINTNKKCLSLRGIKLINEYCCEGCNITFISMHHLSIHYETCKDYKIVNIIKTHKEELKEQIKNVENKYKEQLQLNNDKHKEQLNHKEQKFEMLQLSYDHLQIKYNELKEEYQNKTDKYEAVLERLVTDAINKPTLTTNTVNNNVVRDHLSTTYTIDTITDKQLEQRIRLCLTEEVFWEGQRGLAKMCVESIIKTPDNKMMICCTDTSRGKFKLFDVKGNLKEDIDARLFTDRVSKFIKIVGNEIREAIQENIDNKSNMLVEKNGIEKDQLLKKMEQLGYSLFDVFNVDDHERNKVFRNELAVLSSIKKPDEI